MPNIETLFATSIYRADLGAEEGVDLDELAALSRATAEDDAAGQAWCRAHGYAGYTSYASLNDLPWRYAGMKALAKALRPHAKAFAKALAWDLGGRKLVLDSLWINVLPPGGFHSGHIHPNSVISGTVYVAVPPAASAIRFEDPRLAMMMAAPPLKARAELARARFVPIAPKPGTLLMWESWLRHEVPLNAAETERISISFNFHLI